MADLLHDAKHYFKYLSREVFHPPYYDGRKGELRSSDGLCLTRLPTNCYVSRCVGTAD